MKIEQVRVQNYKSILDSGWVDIEDGLTTLVGANEAGKTNFLEALSKFNSGNEMTEEKLCRYRREYSREMSEIPITSVKMQRPSGIRFNSIVQIQKEYSEISDYYNGQAFIEITKYANGQLYLTDMYTENIDISEYRGEAEQILSKKIASSEKIINGLDMDILYEVRRNTQKEEAENDYVSLMRSIKEINEEIEKFRSKNMNKREEMVCEELTEIRSLIRATYSIKEIHELTPDELSVLPNFKFFENIEPMPEKEDLGSIEVMNPYFEFLDAVSMNNKSLQEESLHKIHTRLEGVNRYITDKFNRNWGQASIQLNLSIINDKVTLRIHEEQEDGRTVSTLPSERSQGFRWFLSFFCHLIAREDGEISDSVILLDDPGAYLHPEGHKDLKAALSNLAEDNQVLYSTHSPYMIDKNRLNSVRLVNHNRGDDSDDEKQETEEDEDEQLGTTLTRLRGADSPLDDSLEAVRMALGASFSDSLFASKKTILVEGQDDRIYLERMSELLGDEDKPLLDDDVNFIDCGGATKADYLARIVDSENYNATVLLDDDKEGRRAKKELTESELSVDVHHTGQYTNVDDKTTIEDLFSDDLICEVAAEIHNEVTEEQLQGRANPDHGEIADKLNGVLKGVGDYENPPNWLLDKMEIARTIDNRAVTEGKEMFEQETLDRFESLIEALNASLNSPGEDTETNEAEATADDD